MTTPEELTARYGLEPLPREGGLFRRTWAGPERPDGRPEGSAIVALLTADDYSALHRLPSTRSGTSTWATPSTCSSSPRTARPGTPSWARTPAPVSTSS